MRLVNNKDTSVTQEPGVETRQNIYLTMTKQNLSQKSKDVNVLVIVAA